MSGWLSGIYQFGKAKAQLAASEVAHGVVWVGKLANDAAEWSIHQAEVAKDAVKTGARNTEAGAGNVGFDAMSATDEAAHKIGEAYTRTANAIANFAKGVKEKFLGKDPAQPIISCPESAAQKAQALTQRQKDLQADGCLISYPAGKCAPVTSKRQALGSADIAKARSTGYQSSGSCCQNQRARRAAQGLPPKQITYVNGINTSLEQACTTIRAIGNQTCATVIGVYNATEGFYKDAIQTNQDRQLIKAANEGKGIPAQDGRNPAVDTLNDLVYNDVMDHNRPEIWAHSQGGAITSLGLFEAGNTLKADGVTNGLSQVTVKSFGSAAPFWPKDIHAEHYINVNDATPNLFGLGANPADYPAKAPGGTVIPFSGPPAGPFQVQHPSKDWVFSPTVHHGMDDTYLGMEKQEHGGC